VSGGQKNAITGRIVRAKSEVETAERELEAALHTIEVLPREQKRGVSELVTDAFQKLRDVREQLAVLEAELKKLDEP
jgi:hypothetical protein